MSLDVEVALPRFAVAVSEAGSPGQVRVVRCPRCGLLLPEYAGLSLYLCDGCSTRLIAKKQVLNRGNLEKSEAEGLEKFCNGGSAAADEGQSQVTEIENRESSHTDRITISGDPATSSAEAEAEISVETERVAHFQLEKSQNCEHPGTPPNKEDNDRAVKAEESAQLNIESSHISIHTESASVDEERIQISEIDNCKSSCTGRISISGDPVASSIIEEAEIMEEIERVMNSQSERSQNCKSPGTPPTTEGNSRHVEAEDSVKLNAESTHISIDTGAMHKEKISALQTEALKSSDDKSQAADNPGVFTEELPLSTDPACSKGKCGHYCNEDMSSVLDMAGSSVGSPAYGNQSNEPRKIHRNDKTGKHHIRITPNQCANGGLPDNQLPDAEVSSDDFLGSEQKIKLGMKQRKEKTVQVETAEGLTYIQQSFEYYGHSKEIRSREQKAPKVPSKKDRTAHRNEGPSNFHTSSVADASNKAGHSRQDKEELLRMLDELREQLSRSSKAKDTPNGRYRINRREDHVNPSRSPNSNGWFQERASMELSVVEEFPQVNGHGLNRDGFHLSLPTHEKRRHFEDPLRSHVHRRPPYESSHHGQLLTSNTHENELFQSGPIPSHLHNARRHQSSCLCTQCSNNLHHMPLHNAAMVSKNQTNPNSAGRHGFSLVKNAEVFNTGYNKSRGSRYPSVPSNAPKFRNSGPLRRCRSLAGAAPFIVCDQCHNLLQLPCDIARNKNKWKIQCGSCLCLLVVKINGIHLTVTVPTPSHSDPTISDVNRTVDGLQDQRHLQQVPTSPCPSDFGGAIYKVASANKPLLLSSTPFSANNGLVEQKSTADLAEFSNREKLPLPPGVSPGQISEVVTCQRETTRLLHDKDLSPHKSYSPVNGIFEYLQSNPAVNNNDTISQGEHLERAHEGSTKDSAVMIKADHPADEFPNSGLSMSGGVSENKLYLRHLSEYSEIPRSSPENLCVSESANHGFGHVASPQIGYRTGTSNLLVTKNYFSVNRYSNQGFPQNSKHEDMEDPRKINKVGRLSFTGLIKKSFKTMSRHTEPVNSGKCKYIINGHPIPDHLIRKAEQYAGPIVPGSYWYDYKAGFWGVQGQPCLGIVPPEIEEFKYPIQKNCSGGNTSILINGRELHQTELNLLAERGLPTCMNKSYNVEISGRVFDAESGEELESLGKLAPNVAQLRRGFGMCPLSLI